MSQPCGCCAGIEIVTPEPEANRPGLGALAYRVGTHATFLETMLARLSTLFLDVPVADGSGTLTRIHPLRALTTRDPSDPSIALLDAWATVADVLTFYQERIANEGYLVTATERRSILELARLVGYTPRPGVSASVFLAFTVTDGFDGPIPAGTRAQSIPGAGELPQFFETATDLTARDAWNDLEPRLTRPQLITLANDSRGRPLDPGTDARTRATLYFQGIATNVKPGDALLIVMGDTTSTNPPQQALRYVESVDVQADQNRTEVTLQQTPERLIDTTNVLTAVTSAVEPFIDQASTIFAGSGLADEVAAILRQHLLADVGTSTDGPTAAGLVNAVLPKVQAKHDIAVKRSFTRLEAWLASIIETLRVLLEDLGDIGTAGGGGPSVAPRPAGGVPPSALANLAAILEPLALPPSVQPANPQRLARTIARTFSPQADTAPRLLATFRPSVATTIYQAWTGVATPSSQVRVYAFRVKAAPYGHNAPQQAIVPARGRPVTYQEWALSLNDLDGLALSLDSAYDKIVPGSWVAIIPTGSAAPPSGEPVIAHVDAVEPVSRADYGMAGRVTRLRVDQNWLSTLPAPPPGRSNDISVLRGATVWAQSDPLDLAEEPLDLDVVGDTIELAELYQGLETGRWIIVSGERTDIPNTTGVMSSELAMISAVRQGSRRPLCVEFPAGILPFTRVYYSSDADAAGDRLVVGSPAMTLKTLGSLIPQATVFDQQYCDQVELAPGVSASAYVPSADELNGIFRDFAGVFQDPFPGSPNPIVNGVIPAVRIDPSRPDAVFAWRISTEPVHTILSLASALAYTYDAASLTISGNVVKATHGQTVGEVLGDGDASRPFQTFALGQAPLTYLPAPTPAGAESSLTLRVNDLEWHEARDIGALGPRDRRYITRTDDADKTSVIFGNGEHGARLPTGTANIKATYRFGIGKAGNVAARQISQLASQPLGLKGVVNPLRASGGADRDSRDEARQNAPLAVEALDRLVSVEDYADFARTFAGIGKARSARLTDGRRLIVHLTVAGADDIPIDKTSDLYQNLVQALHRNGDPYQAIQVTVRKLKVLVISAGVEVLPDYQWEAVERNVRAALLDAFAFFRRDLGQSAFLGEVISTAQRVEGVSYVNVRAFDAVPEDITADKLAGLATSLTLNDVVEADLARVDPAATDPARRILPAELAILTPDIPDTLILTQITTPGAGSAPSPSSLSARRARSPLDRFTPGR